MSVTHTQIDPMAALMAADQAVEKTDSDKETVRVHMTSSLEDAVEKHRKAKDHQNAAKALLSQSGRVLKSEVQGIYDEEYARNPEVKQFAFQGKDHTTWINVRENGYPKFTDELLEAVKEATSQGFVDKHVGTHYSATIHFSKVPNGKEEEVAQYLMGINFLIYGEKWELGNKAQPSLVEVSKETKAKSTFHQGRMTELDDTEQMLVNEVLPVPLAFSGKRSK